MNIKGIIHVGAHYGQEYEIYKRCGVNNSHMIFFEPLTKNFKVLKNHLGDEVTLVKKALGNQNTNVKMHVKRANDGMSSSVLKPKKHLELYPQIVFDSEEIVEMVRLDYFLGAKEKYNFRVIDVQGYELEVFKGGVKTLDNIEYIITEVNKDEWYENCTMIEDLDKFLGQLGFDRVETNWEGGVWGDAFYVKSNVL